MDFLPLAKFRPWAGVGAGYEIAQYKLSDASGGSASISYRRWELANVQLGGDWVLTPKFRAGPFLALSLGQYDEVSIASGGASTDLPIAGKRLHEWLQLGLRGVFDL